MLSRLLLGDFPGRHSIDIFCSCRKVAFLFRTTSASTGTVCQRARTLRGLLRQKTMWSWMVSCPEPSLSIKPRHDLPGVSPYTARYLLLGHTQVEAPAPVLQGIPRGLSGMQGCVYRNPLWRSPSVGRTTTSISTTRMPWAGASSACTARSKIARATTTPTTLAQPGLNRCLLHPVCG